MSKPPEAIPSPPSGVTLNPIPNKTMAEAAAWCAETLEVPVTERYLKNCADSRELRVSLIGGKRYVSTAELWRFITTRPARKADIIAARRRA